MGAAALRGLQKNARDLPVVDKDVVGPFHAHVDIGKKPADRIGNRQRRDKRQLGTFGRGSLGLQQQRCREVALG